MTNYVPIRHEELGVIYFKNPKFNSFGGMDVSYTQVLKSAAGFYIGDLIQEDWSDINVKNECWMPHSRDSQEYWGTREEAEHALITGKYAIKF